VTIPAEVAEEAGVGGGDVVLLRPDEGGEIRIRRADDAFSSE
jgi:bifunctional DNA-binding transcriptional regulator/antitoxin component of YhaV-PrlF toxin-antitoxin module